MKYFWKSFFKKILEIFKKWKSLKNLLYYFLYQINLEQNCLSGCTWLKFNYKEQMRVKRKDFTHQSPLLSCTLANFSLAATDVYRPFSEFISLLHYRRGIHISVHICCLYFSQHSRFRLFQTYALFISQNDSYNRSDRSSNSRDHYYYFLCNKKLFLIIYIILIIKYLRSVYY